MPPLGWLIPVVSTFADPKQPGDPSPVFAASKPPNKDVALTSIRDSFGSLLKREKTTERGLADNDFRAVLDWWTEARLKPNDLTHVNITRYSLAAVPNCHDADHR